MGVSRLSLLLLASLVLPLQSFTFQSALIDPTNILYKYKERCGSDRTPLQTNERLSPGVIRMHLRMTLGDHSLSSRILNGLIRKFPSEQRVIACFDRFLKAKDLDRLLGDGTDSHNRQQANCWVEGIEPLAFHDIDNGFFNWVLGLQENSPIIQREFKLYMEKEARAGGDKWLGARNVQGQAYGPEWKTLGLQDRGLWDEDNVRLFPETCKLLTKLNVPACEAFFARQGSHSGILPHSDFNNFILTCHIGIDVPPLGQCWIKVGNETKYWENGKGLVFDTSIFHSTRNDGDTDRYILLIRFWHPALNEREVKAMSFIFDYLNSAGLGDAALNRFETEHLFGSISPAPSTGQQLDQLLFNGDQQPEPPQPMSRQMRREQSRKEKEDAPAKRGAKGFHRGK